MDSQFKENDSTENRLGERASGKREQSVNVAPKTRAIAERYWNQNGIKAARISSPIYAFDQLDYIDRRLITERITAAICTEEFSSPLRKMTVRITDRVRSEDILREIELRKTKLEQLFLKDVMKNGNQVSPDRVNEYLNRIDQAAKLLIANNRNDEIGRMTSIKGGHIPSSEDRQLQPFFRKLADIGMPRVVSAIASARKSLGSG